MTPDVKSRIEDEIRRFATDLNLSDPQKAQLRTAFENAETKLDEGTPFQKVRGSIREQATKILTPQQLTKWDDAMSKARTFLGHSIKA
jgi:Spy/CpxP family protein refolding chaperone